MFVIITPRPEKAYTLTKEQARKLIRVATVSLPDNPTFAQKLNWWPGWSIIMVIVCIAYMIVSFKQIGAGAWTIDMYNLTFLIIALLLNWRPAVLFDGFKKGITGTWGILSQYPLYGGIFGLIVFTGLGKFLTHVFTSISTTHTFIPIIYWYSGLLSYFVPSAGAKFAMEAGYILPAGQTLGVSAASVTLAYTWGDMLTHLIQPFWAIAILDITETHFGQIAGFCALLFIVYAIIMSAMIFLIPLHL
jgi:short-chain fatty acids transporter